MAADCHFKWQMVSNWNVIITNTTVLYLRTLLFTDIFLLLFYSSSQPINQSLGCRSKVNISEDIRSVSFFNVQYPDIMSLFGGRRMWYSARKANAYSNHDKDRCNLSIKVSSLRS